MNEIASGLHPTHKKYRNRVVICMKLALCRWVRPVSTEPVQMPTEHEHNKKQVKRETAAVTRVPCVLDFHAYSYETKCLCLFEFASWLASVGLTTDKY